MTINIACVKSNMLDTEFMVGAMTWAALANQVFPPDDDRWNEIFEGSGDDEAQRKLNKARVKDALVPYLTENRDAFFSAITLLMIPMDGTAPKEGQDYHFKILNDDDGPGILVIEDHVMLFPADGQHRQSGISGAIKASPGLAREHVPVVIIPYKGKVRTRQLFSDLNLNAKPVSKSIGYAFESRNPVVLVTKRVIQDVPLLQGRVNMTTNSLSARSADVVTLSTLVNANIEVLAAIAGVPSKLTNVASIPDLKEATSKPISSQEVEHVSRPLVPLWETFVTHTPGWHELLSGTVTAGEIRDGNEEEGTPGYVSAYGVGWQAAAVAYAALVRSGDHSDELEVLAHCLDSVNWEKGRHWNGIAMIGNRINNTGPGIRASAGYILKQGRIKYPTDEKGQPDSGHQVGSLINAYLRSLAEVEEEEAA